MEECENIVVGDRGYGRIDSRGERDGFEFWVGYSSIDIEDGSKEGKVGNGEFLERFLVE